jgi:hypothetical protein
MLACVLVVFQLYRIDDMNLYVAASIRLDYDEFVNSNWSCDNAVVDDSKKKSCDLKKRFCGEGLVPARTGGARRMVVVVSGRYWAI